MTVESGETMKAAGLKAIDTVMNSQAVLISSRTSGTCSPNLSGGNGDLQTLITNRIRGVIAAKMYVLLNYNIPRSMLPEVVKITPGKRAPTVSPLEGADWVAVSVMVERKSAARVMDSLENKGASDILMFNIINSRLSIIQNGGLTHQGLDSMTRLHIQKGFYMERKRINDIRRITSKLAWRDPQCRFSYFRFRIHSFQQTIPTPESNHSHQSYNEELLLEAWRRKP